MYPRSAIAVIMSEINNKINTWTVYDLVPASHISSYSFIAAKPKILENGVHCSLLDEVSFSDGRDSTNLKNRD